jgi:hypothetical protein
MTAIDQTKMPPSFLSLDAQVISDGRTVWVNAPTGECLARFGRYGVDIHRTVTDQLEGMPECLTCTHALTTAKDWLLFQSETLRHHGIKIDDTHKPTYLVAR